MLAGGLTLQAPPERCSRLPRNRAATTSLITPIAAAPKSVVDGSASTVVALAGVGSIADLAGAARVAG